MVWRRVCAGYYEADGYEITRRKGSCYWNLTRPGSRVVNGYRTLKESKGVAEHFDTVEKNRWMMETLKTMLA